MGKRGFKAVEDKMKELSLKNELRRELLKRRGEVNNSEAERAVFEKIIKEDAFLTAEVIFCYVSYGSEVGTRLLIRESLRLGKTLVVPKCTDYNGHMIGIEIKSEDDLKKGMFGIFEPEGEEFEREKIDLAIVPGIAFDKEGFRLGYGKGYYDRFLKGLKAKTIGICHKHLLFDKLPRGKYDIPVGKVIS